MSTIIEQSTLSASNIDVNSLTESLKYFGTADYAVFVAMLACSTLVGLYFGYKDHQTKRKNKKLGRQTNADDYLVGGRKMKVVPIALSLVASYASGITLLGTSTEIYLYGTQYCFFLLAIICSAFIIHFIVIPVFYELKITSTNEYLEARFNRKLRLMGSVSFLIAIILYLPIVIYVPALAFNQLTGINIHVITPISMFICIFYTSLGGIKAVVWTDVLQITLMYGTLLLIAIKGTSSIGGLGVLIERNIEGGRFDAPDFRLDPTLRHTFWTLTIGGSIWWTSINGTSQASIQRYLSVKNLKKSQMTHILFTIGVIVLISLCIYNGLLLFAMYHDCDPLKTKLAKAKDQLLPLLAMETLKDYPGLSGLFISGVFSAALSSASTVLNSMAAVVLYDFFNAFRSEPLSKRGTEWVMRGTVIIAGIIAVLLVYVVENLGAVLQLSMSIPAAVGGPLLGVFIIGIMLPWIGARATYYATICSCVATFWIIFKAQMEIMSKRFVFPAKDTSIDGCSYNFTSVLPIVDDVTEDEYKHDQIYHISYLYYILVGSMLVIVISVVFSLFMGFQDPRSVDRKLIAPFMRRHIHFDPVDTKDDEETVVKVYEMQEFDAQK
ncbi:sodium-coupled monocarboxylate transporter 1-like [Chironomus tepperi]|uniref:sodium-coupled monocarboxylate transporter 1-like n=1 Tax=Chironomus tepperi TaxID=113505 RepID=UPI00391F9A79